MNLVQLMKMLSSGDLTKVAAAASKELGGLEGAVDTYKELLAANPQYKQEALKTLDPEAIKQIAAVNPELARLLEGLRKVAGG